MYDIIKTIFFITNLETANYLTCVNQDGDELSILTDGYVVLITNNTKNELVNIKVLPFKVNVSDFEMRDNFPHFTAMNGQLKMSYNVENIDGLCKIIKIT